MLVRVIVVVLLVALPASAEEESLPHWTLEELAAGRVEPGAEGWVDVQLGERHTHPTRWSWMVHPVHSTFDPVFHFRTGEELPVLLARPDGVSLPQDRRRIARRVGSQLPGVLGR